MSERKIVSFRVDVDLDEFFESAEHARESVQVALEENIPWGAAKVRYL